MSPLLNMAATTASGAQQAQSQMHEVDPISKFKLLIPPLKESLAVRDQFTVQSVYVCVSVNF